MFAPHSPLCPRVRARRGRKTPAYGHFLAKNPLLAGLAKNPCIWPLSGQKPLHMATFCPFGGMPPRYYVSGCPMKDGPPVHRPALHLIAPCKAGTADAGTAAPLPVSHRAGDPFGGLPGGAPTTPSTRRRLPSGVTPRGARACHLGNGAFPTGTRHHGGPRRYRRDGPRR